jgi:hypothetical protein
MISEWRIGMVHTRIRFELVYSVTGQIFESDLHIKDKAIPLTGYGGP